VRHTPQFSRSFACAVVASTVFSNAISAWTVHTAPQMAVPLPAWTRTVSSKVNGGAIDDASLLSQNRRETLSFGSDDNLAFCMGMANPGVLSDRSSIPDATSKFRADCVLRRPADGAALNRVSIPINSDQVFLARTSGGFVLMSWNTLYFISTKWKVKSIDTGNGGAYSSRLEVSPDGAHVIVGADYGEGKGTLVRRFDGDTFNEVAQPRWLPRLPMYWSTNGDIVLLDVGHGPYAIDLSSGRVGPLSGCQSRGTAAEGSLEPTFISPERWPGDFQDLLDAQSGHAPTAGAADGCAMPTFISSAKWAGDFHLVSIHSLRGQTHNLEAQLKPKENASQIVSSPSERFAILFESTHGGGWDASPKTAGWEVAVYDPSEGRRVFAVPIAPRPKKTLLLALSADGHWLAILADDALSVYELP